MDSSAQAATGGGGRERLPIWAREHDRRRSTLSRDAIVKSAIDIADSEGLPAVSIRRIAAELGARTMSLYTYIGSKEDLLDLMGDEVAGETLIKEKLPEHWREAITLIMRRERDVVLRHRWLPDLLNHGMVRWVGPNGLRQLNQSVAALCPLGLDPLATWRVLAALDDYLHGYVVREVREMHSSHGDVLTDTEREVFSQPYLRELVDAGELSHVAPLLRRGLSYADRNFEQGLDWLLDGIERDYG